MFFEFKPCQIPIAYVVKIRIVKIIESDLYSSKITIIIPKVAITAHPKVKI